MISVHAANGDYVWVSSNCQNLFGWRPEDLVGRSAYELFDPEDIARIAEDHARHVRGELGAVRYRLKCVDGSFCWVETRSRSSPDGDYIVAITRDVQGDQEILAELGRRAFQDLVTDLPNRFALEEALDREMARAERESAPCPSWRSIWTASRRSTTPRGMKRGDRFLQEVARRITAVLRGYDVAGRWGGDEFLLLLPGVADEIALLVGERVRAAVEEIGEDSSVSIGVSSTVLAGSRRDCSPRPTRRSTTPRPWAATRSCAGARPSCPACPARAGPSRPRPERFDLKRQPVRQAVIPERDRAREHHQHPESKRDPQQQPRTLTLFAMNQLPSRSACADANHLPATPYVALSICIQGKVAARKRLRLRCGNIRHRYPGLLPLALNFMR